MNTGSVDINNLFITKLTNSSDANYSTADANIYSEKMFTLKSGKQFTSTFEYKTQIRT